MPILNTIPYTFRAQLPQHAYPQTRAPLHHEGGLPYTILHGKTLNPKHIAK